MILQESRSNNGQNAHFRKVASGFVIAIFLISSILAGCQSQTKSQNPEEKTTDFYKEQVKITHAKGFTVKYFDKYKLVDIISPFAKSADTVKYILLERGTERPAGYTGRQLIEIPIRSMIAMSSMHIGMLKFLEAENILTGLGDLQYVYSPTVVNLIKEGKIAGIGKNNGINQEKLISLHPDLFMVMGSPGAQKENYPVLKQAEIPVLSNSEWGESTPLARAEWVKLMAVLLNKEELVNTKFAKIETEYQKLQKLAAQSKSKPTILSGLNTKDTWYLPSGQNYMTAFFIDAGGAYPWTKETGTGSFSLNFEAIYPYALTADAWLNVGFNPMDTRHSILQMDSRYSDFKAFKSGSIYSYNNKVNAAGSNDFFESGMMEPEVVLADLIKILHPDLLPDHQLVYYKQIR